MSAAGTSRRSSVTATARVDPPSCRRYAALAASFTTITAHDLLLFGLLLGCTALAVELSRKAGEQGGMIKDVQGVWELPVAILLPPLYALIAPITRIALMQWRVRRPR